MSFSTTVFRGLEWKSREEKKWDTFINQRHSWDNSRSYMSTHTDVKDRYVCSVSLILVSLIRGYHAVTATSSDVNMFFLFCLIPLRQCFVWSCVFVKANSFVVSFWINIGKMQLNMLLVQAKAGVFCRNSPSLLLLLHRPLPLEGKWTLIKPGLGQTTTNVVWGFPSNEKWLWKSGCLGLIALLNSQKQQKKPRTDVQDWGFGHRVPSPDPS